MNGILVINHFLKSEKFNILHTHLAKTARDMGISLDIKTNQEMIFFEGEADFVLFWDKDVHLAKALEAKGFKVFNSAKSIDLCDNKAKTYLALDGVVKQPKTIIAPLAYHKCDYTDFVNQAVARLGLPVVYKECYGSFGEQVHLCHSVQQVLDCIGDKEFLLQQFITQSSGRDIRIEVVGGVCVSAMRRSNDSDFRSNITNGGTAEAYSPTDEEKALAITACNALGLTFGGVDILDGGYVCEVNSNAHIINIMHCNGVDVAPLIFEAIISKINNIDNIDKE